MDELWDGWCVSSVVVVNNLVVCWVTDDVWYKSLGIWVGVARGNKNARQAADAMIGAGRVVRRFRRNAACRAHIGFFTVSEWSKCAIAGGERRSCRRGWSTLYGLAGGHQARQRVCFYSPFPFRAVPVSVCSQPQPSGQTGSLAVGFSRRQAWESKQRGVAGAKVPRNPRSQ